jgi:hypothetical protein
MIETRPLSSLARPLIALAAALAMVLGMAASPASAVSHGQVEGTTIRDLDVPLLIDEEPAQFTGRIVNLTFDAVGGTLVASGRLVGTLTQDGTTRRINETFSDVQLPLPEINGDGGSCQILFLELGPIFLDLLGLVVEVPDPIVVEIRAEPGPGALLGNLLCAIVGLLD